MYFQIMMFRNLPVRIQILNVNRTAVKPFLRYVLIMITFANDYYTLQCAVAVVA